MRLQRIYSSKLYVTSSRKDRIHAAMQNPINAELVQQLAEYLDDDGQVELRKAETEILQKQQEQENSEADAAAPVDDSPFTPSHSGGGGAPSHSSFSGDVFEDFGEDGLEGVEPLDENGEPPAPPEEPVEENTAIMGKVMATSLVWTTLEDVVSECDVIRGTLNSHEDTNGVNRLQVKDNELWIYFNDDVNLNDKMVDVIEVLNSTGYTYLAFSRLARSNNAIVFDINLNYQDDIKSSKDVEESK